MKKLSLAARDGVKAADWLLERAPRALFDEFRRRPGSLRTTRAVRRLDGLNDSAVLEIVAEAEERAWHAAWNAAIGLCTGRRYPGTERGQ